MDKFKGHAREGIKTAKAIIRGLEDLVLALAMIVCAYYNADTLQMQPEVADFELYIRALSSAVFVAVGAYKTVKVLKAIGEQK